MTAARVEVTRPDKLLWPAIGITKQAYVDYLGAVADRMLPWLRDRPLSLVRAPDGVHFCPAGKDAHRGVTATCPVWSSGAYRYGSAMAQPVVLDLTTDH